MWLEYSIERDAVFCKPCRHFPGASKVGDHDGAFSVTGFVDISKDQTALGITTSIQELISPIELNPIQCVGLSFDGASVMSGYKGGVQAILKKYYIDAVFVHCHSHRLNLVLQEVSSLCPEVADCFALCDRLFVFFGHPKRLSLLKEKQAEYRPD